MRRAAIIAVGIVVAAGGAALSIGGSDQLCAQTTANIPDGPDPWGGCWPGDSNTGPPDGVTLTAYTGPCIITEDDTIIDSKTVDCFPSENDELTIQATGVVVTNSYIDASVTVFGSATFTDSTIDGQPINGLIDPNTGNRAIEGHNFDLLRVELTGGCCGAWCDENCTFQDIYVHGQDDDEGGDAHQSGIRQDGGAVGNGQTFIHNTVSCTANVIDDGDGDPSGCSADVTGYGDFNTVQNNYWYRNLLVSPTSGVWCAYGGSTTGKPFPNGTNNEWHENVFQKGPTGTCNSAGAMNALAAGVRGNVWDSNVWDDGTTMPPPGD